MRKVGDRITNRFGQQGTIRNIMNNDYFVKMNYQNENNDYKVFHGNQLKALRKANITARQAAKGLTPGRISFNPDVRTQNNNTVYPLGPNSGPERPKGEYVSGTFSKLHKGYTGEYNESVPKTPGSLWQSTEDYRAVRRGRHSPFAKNYENAVSPEKAKERANKLHETLIGPVPVPVPDPVPVPWYRRMIGLSGGNTNRNRNRNRKQKTKKQRKNHK